MKNIYYCILFIFLSVKITGQALPIVIDGRFDDWKNSEANYTDGSGSGNQINLLNFSVSNDEDYLYIRFSSENEFLLNDNNEFFLEIDTDNDPYTGYYTNGIGAELRWCFGEREGYFYLFKQSSTIYFSDIRLRALPTVTSNEFEIAIGRDAKPDGYDLFTNNTIKICFRDYDSNGDLMPDEGDTFSYTFDNNPVTPYQPVDFEKEYLEIVRLLSYNVLSDGISDYERIPSFKRIISAINPDIITFNECWDTESWKAGDLLDNILPLQGGAEWQTVKLVSGNITCSKFPITESVVVYSNGRIQASHVNLPSYFPKDIVVINSHFRCCDANYERQYEADAIIDFILNEKTSSGVLDLPEGTPMVISGDLNLVGNSQQLTTLVTGEIINTSHFGQGGPPDWDNSSLEDNVAIQSDIRMAYTWRKDYSSYWPGRLDFSIFTNSVAEAVKSFVVQTEVMLDERLDLYGLQKHDSEIASDHFARVTDFKIKAEQGVNDEINSENIINITTLAENNTFEILLDLKNKSDVNFRIFDIQGTERIYSSNKNLCYGKHIFNIDVSMLKHGVYILVIETNKKIYRQKVVI
ncbi:MAG: T9SS type A sorting domain-containing protein [Bacteroidales bacterium]|nr:T9SS type A sorting domain-containing protein [Bacteroidales bacterium]